MEKRIFKKDLFKMLLELEEVKTNMLLTNFIHKELELLDKKSSSKSGKISKTTEENLIVKKIIKSNLTEEGIRIQDLADKIEYPRAKVASLLAIMHKEKQVSKHYVKKVVYFTSYNESYDSTAASKEVGGVEYDV